MNCFNLVHAFFQVWLSVKHILRGNVTKDFKTIIFKSLISA